MNNGKNNDYNIKYNNIEENQMKFNIDSKLPDINYQPKNNINYHLQNNNDYKINGDINNIFNNNSPSIHFKNKQSLHEVSNRLKKYNGEAFDFRERFFTIPDKLNNNSEISFSNQNNFKSHYNLTGTMSGTAGSLAGDVIYDFATQGSTNIGTRDIARSVYNAAAWEGVQAGSMYAAAYFLGSEAIVPVKIGYAVLDYNAVLKHEFDYLIKEGIFTTENIFIARTNARMITSVNVFSAELKFASKVGSIINNVSVSAVNKVNSRMLLDKYNYTPHKKNTFETIYVFKTKYLEYPIITVVGGVHDIIDKGIEFTGDVLEGGYYLISNGVSWIKHKIVGTKVIQKPTLEDTKHHNNTIDNLSPLEIEILKEVINESNDDKTESDSFWDKPDYNQSLAEPDYNQETKHETKHDSSNDINDSSNDINDSSNDINDDKDSEDKNGNVEEEIIEVDTDDMNSSDPDDMTSGDSDNKFFIIKNSENNEEVVKFVKKIKDRQKYIVLAQRIGELNKFLEGAVLFKNFKNMSHFERNKQIIGFALRNFESDNLGSEGLKIIHTFGKLWSKDKLELKDITDFVALFPDVPDPVINMLKIGFAMVDGKPKEIEQAFLGVTISLLAAANPVFAVGQVLYTTVKLLDQLLTTRKIIEISGIQAVYTDKIRITLRQGIHHKCTVVNQKFGISITTRRGHKRDARRDAENQFKKQLPHKFYQVIGLPSILVDPNYVKPETRLEKMLFNQYLQSLYTNWLIQNKKYFTQEEFDLLEREFFETPQQKEFRVWLNDNGFQNSWFSKHSNENPIEFSQSIYNELKGCSFVEGLKHFFNLFQCNKLEGQPLTESQITDIKDNAENTARDSRTKDDNNQLDAFNDSETDKFKNGEDQYSQNGLLIKMEKDLVIKHISVGYIVNSSISSFACGVGGSIAYLDREIVMIYQRPLNYICYKSQQLANSAFQGYISNCLTDHVMLIPSIMLNEEQASEAFLQNLAPFVGVGAGTLVTVVSNCFSGKSKKEIFKNSFASAVNQSLTSGIMQLTKETAFMKAINEFSKSQALNFLKLTSLAIPHTFVSSVITSALICITQRIVIEGGKKIYQEIDRLIYKPCPKAVEFWNKSTQLRVNNIYETYGQNDHFFRPDNSPNNYKNKDPFFKEKKSDPFFNNNNLALQVI